MARELQQGPRTGYLAVAAVTLLLGFLISQQWRLQDQERRNASLAKQRSSELIQTLQKTDAERQSLQVELEKLRDQVGRYEGGAEARRLMAALSGFEQAKGPGVSIDVESGLGGPGNEVRDEDLLKIVNELRAAGAEGLAVNGQRLVATSEIRLAGRSVLVNGKAIHPPYQILAIGDPEVMDNALHMPFGVIDSLKTWRISVRVQRKPEVTLPAFGGGVAPRYLQALPTP